MEISPTKQPEHGNLLIIQYPHQSTHIHICARILDRAMFESISQLDAAIEHSRGVHHSFSPPPHNKSARQVRPPEISSSVRKVKSRSSFILYQNKAPHQSISKLTPHSRPAPSLSNLSLSRSQTRPKRSHRQLHQVEAQISTVRSNARHEPPLHPP